MKFCTKCGNKIIEDELFCTFCGNGLRKENIDEGINNLGMKLNQLTMI